MSERTNRWVEFLVIVALIAAVTIAAITTLRTAE